jgi:hypothetical protein
LITEASSVSFSPNAPQQKGRNCIPNNDEVILIDPPIPTRQKIHHPFRHNPLYPKHLKNNHPKLSCDITMKKKMIQGFPNLFTYITPVYHAMM